VARTEKAAIVEFHVFALSLQFDRVENGIGRNETRQADHIQEIVQLDERQSNGRHRRRHQLVVCVMLRPALDRHKYLNLRCTERVTGCQLT